MIQIRVVGEKVKIATGGADKRYMRQFAQQNGTTESEEAMLSIMALCWIRLTDKSKQRFIAEKQSQKGDEDDVSNA